MSNFDGHADETSGSIAHLYSSLWYRRFRNAHDVVGNGIQFLVPIYQSTSRSQIVSYTYLTEPALSIRMTYHPTNRTRRRMAQSPSITLVGLLTPVHAQTGMAVGWQQAARRQKCRPLSSRVVVDTMTPTKHWALLRVFAFADITEAHLAFGLEIWLRIRSRSRP